MYGLARNRIANVDTFECTDTSPTPLDGDIQCFTLWYQWLASRQLRDGLLGDLIDPIPPLGARPGLHANTYTQQQEARLFPAAKN